MENKLLQVIRICALYRLIDFLGCDDKYSDTPNKIIRNGDLFNLMMSNSWAKKYLYKRMIEISIFKSSTIKKWKNKQGVRRIVWDRNTNIFTKNIYVNDNHFMDNIIELIFNSSFNDVVVQLPNNLRILEFGFSYNQKIEMKVLPKTLKCLIFGYVFNKILEKSSLPENLECIRFSGNYPRKYILSLTNFVIVTDRRTGKKNYNNIIVKDSSSKLQILSEYYSKNHYGCPKKYFIR
jgi:hypothetical protein